MKLQTMPLRFRAWDTIEKRFLKNDELLDFSRGFINFYDEEMIMSGGRDFIISQDTGLKDKNGKSIYTGDIIVDHSYLIEYTHKLTGAVVASDVVAGYTIAPVLNDWKPSENIVLSKTNRYEVIGNIWQTAELLENNDGKR